MILDKFKEIAATVNNPYVKKFKEKGGKVIGYCVSSIPVAEVYHSVGMCAVRTRANEVNTTTIGDTYYGPVICGFPKSLIQMAGEGRYKFLDGLLTSTICDALRRLDDCWRKAATDYEGIMPGFYYFFGVPHKALDFSVKWFTDELNKHNQEMEKHFGVKINKDDLWKSIKLYNEGRRLLRKFDELRWRDNVPVSGADALSVFIAASSIPMDDFVDLMKKLIPELEKSTEKKKGKRLLVAGSVNDDPSFIQSIEEVGAVVVADIMSFGSRYYENMIEETGKDPIAAIAKAYLVNLKHPRMFGEYQPRLAHMKKRIAEAKVQGVILQNIRFCDLHGCENGVYEKDLEEAGIPCLKMEREYGTLVESGRVKMRVQAFLERIS